MNTTMRRLASSLVAGLLLLSSGAPAQEDGAKNSGTTGSGPSTIDDVSVLDASTAHLAKGLLPPELLEHYRKGEYRNEILPWARDEGLKGPVFQEQTKKNAGILDVDEKGTIIDKRTGKQPSYIYGTPFPNIDPDDPSAGVKIVWNYFYNYWWNGNSRNVISLVWLNPDDKEREAVQDVYFKYYDGLPPEYAPEENPDNLLMQFIAATTSPADLYGTTALTWRFRDAAKRDAVWAYVPALRRIRALSPSNRSDGFLGSDMSQDDGPFFDGKPEDFKWSLVGEREALVFVDPYRLRGGTKTVELPDGGWRGIFPDIPNIGFQKDGWEGLAWAPVGAVLSKRPVWVVEGVPRDEYYLYGKLQLWIDKLAWTGAFNRKFSWKGELMSSYHVSGGPARPGPRDKYRFSSGLGGGIIAQIAENVKQNRATAATVDPDDNIPNDRHIPLEPAFFDYQSLYRFGK